MRALVTGGGGFVGQWLARALVERGDSVDLAGLGAPFAGPPILSDAERRCARWLELDVRNAAQIDEVVERSAPELIVHLAGVSFPPEAERSPETTYDVNTIGAVRLLAAVERRRAAGTLDPTVIVVGSGTQYGVHDETEMPLDETAEQRPAWTYAASKAAQETVAIAMHRATGIHVICARSFNHSGVGHGEQYLLPSLVARAHRIERGEPGPLVIGNDVVRDYLHVADVVRAYLALAARGRPGESYNVSSGHGLSTRQLAADVLLRAGVRADITTASALVRRSDIPTLIVSPTKPVRDTVWTPRHTHAYIIDDVLNAATD